MPLDCTILTRVTHMRVGGHLYPIDSYEHASSMFCTALQAWDGPEDDIPDASLCNDDGQELGYVSRNGRCWIGRRGAHHATCVYAP